MASIKFEKKPIPGMFLGVDDIAPEYECTMSGQRLSGIWVYIGGTARFFECDRYTVCSPDEIREDAYRQAFALMREVYDMTATERREAFSKTKLGEVLRDASYDDLAEKLDAWKKEKEAIHVRDEVVNAVGKKFVVTVAPYMGSNSVLYFSGIAKDGTVCKDQPVATYKKTGLHVDDLDKYLEV